MNKNKKVLARLCFSLMLCGQLVLAESPVTSAFENVTTVSQNQHISNEIVTPIPSNEVSLQNTNIPPIPTTQNNTPMESGFKDTLMSKVDEKFAKLDDIERRLSEQQLQNQLNQSNSNFGSGSSMGGSLSVPVVIGSTIIEKGKKVISKNVLAVDSSGNKFNLNEKNNNVIKSISNDYIVFKDSKDKFPLLISNNMSSSSETNAGAFGSASIGGISGFPNSMLEVPNSIKMKAENSQAIGSLQDNNVSNTLR